MRLHRLSRNIAIAAGVAAIVLGVAWLLLQRMSDRLDRQIALATKSRALSSEELTHLRSRQAALPKNPISQPIAAETPANSDEGTWRAAAAARRRRLLQAWFDLSYSRFLKKSALTADQKDRFEAAVVEHWVRWAETMDVVRESHLAPTDPALPSLLKLENSEFSADEQSALGVDCFGALQQFLRTAAAQTVADSVAGLVFDSGQPLNAAQAEAITQIVATNSAQYKAGGPANLDDLDSPTVLREAQRVLTPVQLAALQTSISTQPALHQLSWLMAYGHVAKP